MICEEVEELAGAYALGALPPSVFAEVERHLSSCDKHDEIAELSGVAAALAATVPEMDPPPALKARIMEAIGSERSTAPQATDRPASDNWLRRLFGRRLVPYAFAGALAAAVVAVIVIIALPGGNTDPTGKGDFVKEFENGRITGTLVYTEEDRALVISAFGLDHLPVDESFQVWTLTDGQATPIGFLEPSPQIDGTVEGVGVIEGLDLTSGESIAVTVEPLRGSPQPTTPPLFEVQL